MKKSVMDILIFQAGEQLGPFSETQVRQYLVAGMISPSDMAIYEGMESWQSLDQVLASLPPPPADELGTILPDVPPAEASPAELQESAPEQPFIMHTTSSETVESTSAPPPAESTLSLTASQKTKRKISKIVIQPIKPLEATSPIPQLNLNRKKLQTGKTAVTLEPIRPTTALPPVTGYVPRERKPVKTLIRTGPVSLTDSPPKPTSPATPAPPVASAPPPPLPVPPKEPQLLPSTTPLLPEKTKTLSEPKAGGWRIPSEILYAGAAMGLLIFCVVISFLFLIFVHDKTPPAANPENAPPPPEHAQAAAPVVAPQPPVEVTPQTAAEYSDRGFTRQSKGDLDGALSDYNTALGLDAKNVTAYYRRGLALEAKGDWNGALSDYNTVIGLDPKNADAFSNRGFVKQAQGDPDGAVADYNLALQINPKISKAYYNEGLIEVQKGALDNAIAAFNQALEIDPQMPLAFYNRANAKFTEGNLDGAIADYTQALALDPKIARAYSDRGIARQTRGDTDGALADYSAALALDPSIAVAYFKRGQIETQKGDLDGAIADSTQAISLDPKNGPAYFNRGLAYLGKASLDQATADLGKFVELNPRDNGADTAHIYLWLIATEQNPQGDADQQLSTAVQNDWNSTPEDLSSKIASFLLGHIKEREFIADAATPDPSLEPAQYCRVYYFAGMKRLMAGDMTTAISYFQKCLSTGQKDACETVFAQAELQALGQNREVAAKPEAGQ